MIGIVTVRKVNDDGTIKAVPGIGVNTLARQDKIHNTGLDVIPGDRVYITDSWSDNTCTEWHWIALGIVGKHVLL